MGEIHWARESETDSDSIAYCLAHYPGDPDSSLCANEYLSISHKMEQFQQEKNLAQSTL